MIKIKTNFHNILIYIIFTPFEPLAKLTKNIYLLVIQKMYN